VTAKLLDQLLGWKQSLKVALSASAHFFLVSRQHFEVFIVQKINSVKERWQFFLCILDRQLDWLLAGWQNSR
jgi:hypothetical protein